jgi:hypothetical protein
MKKSISVYFAEIIPIILFFSVYLYPDESLEFSQDYLGKALLIMIIIFYTSIHVLYGLLVCSLVILYYQSDMLKEYIEVFDMPIEESFSAYEPPEYSDLHFYTLGDSNAQFSSVMNDRFATEELLFYGL